VYLLFCFFFFQAEDGIRDRTVTGVQTCALPISQPREEPVAAGGHRIAAVVLAAGRSTRMGGPNKLVAEIGGKPLVRIAAEQALRSEERRVGKSVECGGGGIIKKKTHVSM